MISGQDGSMQYASRAGVWEDNDPSLTVKCHNSVPSRNKPESSEKNEISDVIEQVFTDTTTLRSQGRSE